MASRLARVQKNKKAGTPRVGVSRPGWSSTGFQEIVGFFVCAWVGLLVRCHIIVKEKIDVIYPRRPTIGRDPWVPPLCWERGSECETAYLLCTTPRMPGARPNVMGNRMGLHLVLFNGHGGRAVSIGRSSALTQFQWRGLVA